MSGTWYFPSNAHGKRPGFNDAGIDLFHGDPVGSLVRESIQNSLDASQDDNRPVRVAFTLDQLDAEGQQIALGLKKPMELGLKKATDRNDQKALYFYANAVKILDAKKSCTVLGIHDFGTTGLTGTTDDNLDEKSAWLALVKGTGDTVKRNSGAGGSYGHGSSAPLALSAFRSVLYYSVVEHEGRREERFQGTSRLESLPASDLIGLEGWTQDQGHFGDGELCGPLLDSSVPEWFRNQRTLVTPEELGDERGTSIFVLAPQIPEKADVFWQKVLIATLANYYYTIALGKLEVTLGEKYFLTSDSLETYLSLFVDAFEEESDLATEDTIDRLQTSLTIATNHRVENINVDGFGSIDLLFRLDDSISRSHVGIARSNGMLITRKPWMLTSDKFTGLKKFDLFVYVKDDDGNELLRKLEPPAHNAFEINRIEDDEEKKRIRKVYTKFKTEIWNFVRDAAKHEIVEEYAPKELSKYFKANWAGEISGDQDPTNYSLVHGSFRRIKAPQGIAVWGNPDDEVGVVPRMGKERRGGEKKDLKPNFEDPLGEDFKKGKKSRRQVSDLRIVRDAKNPQLATVHFNTVDKTHRHLVLLRSGADTVVEPIRFRPEKSEEWTTRLDLVSVKKGDRKTLRLVFDPEALLYSLEARLES